MLRGIDPQAAHAPAKESFGKLTIRATLPRLGARTSEPGSQGGQAGQGGSQQPTTPPTAPAPQQPNQKGLVSNVFAGTDIREALSDVASAAGVTIIPDDSIKESLVYMEFRNEPVESAIDKLALSVGAFWKKKSDGVYLFSKATPDASQFREFAQTVNYMPQNEPASSIIALLPADYKLYVQSDLKPNLITVTAPEQLVPRILADLQKIDAPLRQFVVEALVTEIDNAGDKDFGFSWSWQHFASDGNLNLSYSTANFSDIATLKALISSHKATLRANPRLTAFEGREATMSVGQETYFSILTGNIQFPTAQIQLIKTGVTLTFTGYIAQDGTITLDLQPEVSDAIVSVNGNPTTNVRRAETMVRVKPGETIAIGGLIQESTSRDTTKVPILGNIPLLGELFTQRTTNTQRSEVIILITPRLTDDGAGERGTDSNRRLPPP